MLRLKIIACDVLNREISYLSSQSRCFADVTFLHQGLHDTPEKLREALQKEIDRAEEGFPYNYFDTAPSFDYIVIGYGLCSNGVVGISSKSIPIIVPRGHDCITLLLGSKSTYKQYFDANPGTYWFSAGWIERAWQPSEKRFEATYKAYLEKYGEDNAQYLMEMEQGWLRDYKNAAYISWASMPDNVGYREFTRESAKFLKWGFIEFEGDSALLERMMNGIFDENEVLIVPPGRKIVQSYDDGIIKAE